MRTCRPAASFQLVGSSGACSRATSWVWEARSSLIIHTRYPSGHSLWGRRGERRSITGAQGIQGRLRLQSQYVIPGSCHPSELTWVCLFYLLKPNKAEGSPVICYGWDSGFPPHQGLLYQHPQKNHRERDTLWPLLGGGHPGWSPETHSQWQRVLPCSV